MLTDSGNNESEVQKLKDRVAELERQLADAQAALLIYSTQGHVPRPERASQPVPVPGTDSRLELDRIRLDAVLEYLPVGVWIADREGRLVGKNERADRIWAGDAPLLSGIQDYGRYSAWFSESGKPLEPEQYPVAVALRTGEPVEPVELTIRRFDGTTGTVLVSAVPIRDEQGALTGAVGVNVDITGRKEVEQALLESEQRFHSLADSMPQLVWTALPDGRVDYYNRRYLEYQEIKVGNGQDWEWTPVLHPDDVHPTVHAWLHAVETGKIYQIEHRVRMSDGSFRWHLSRGVPMRDEAGRIIRWFGTATDIQDLKLAEEKLKEYADRLERSNRELEQFASIVSHDLQEPLQKIEMSADLLKERAPRLDGRERAYLDQMRNAADRMREMIDGLLALSSVATEGRPFVPVDLSVVASEVLSELDDKIRHTGGQVDLEALPVVLGDPLQMRQLLQNLVGNGLKYYRPGSPPQVRIHARQDPDRAHIYVEDQGIGFDQEQAELIFEPFRRLVGRSQYVGNGIGLAVCRRIVERHRGAITAISEPDYGTTFIVSLPLPPG